MTPPVCPLEDEKDLKHSPFHENTNNSCVTSREKEQSSLDDNFLRLSAPQSSVCFIENEETRPHQSLFDKKPASGCSTNHEKGQPASVEKSLGLFPLRSAPVCPIEDEEEGFKNSLKQATDEEQVGNDCATSEEKEMSALEERSLGLFPLESAFRQRIITFVSSGSWFDKFILIMILLNSVVMACVDYRYVDDEYSPRSDISMRNYLVEKAEIWFNVLFIVECVLKVVAHGFMFGKNTYIRNHWNKLDFLVVVLSIVGMVPLMPNLSIIRSFRVLRPLRSISKLPGLKKIIGSLVDSLKDLGHVMLLLFFLLTCFSITGVMFWRGLFHARCRLTPFPVQISSQCRNASDVCWGGFLNDVIADPDAHRCLPFPNDSKEWTQSTSPWYLEGPQDCVWPIDDEDPRVCNLWGGGAHSCGLPKTEDDGNNFIQRTCGSNFDKFGNPRFIDTTEPYGYPRMKSGVFIEDLNWGFTNFDNFLSAFITSFQVVSLEGWTDIMYQTIDAWYTIPTVLLFAIIVVVGGYIVLNLVLAVITNSLDNLDEKEGSRLNPKNGRKSTPSQDTKLSGLRLYMTKFVESKYHSGFVMSCIVVNTFTLSLDHYGISVEMVDALEAINFILTFIFFIDMVLCITAYGFKEYWSNPSSCFDGCIVISSLAELTLVHAYSEGSSGPSSFSIFRSLRLFRIFKMAKSWKSLHLLLQTMNETVLEIGNFAILLLLFIFIYALIGMQMFSNRLHFHPDTGAVVHISDEDYDIASVPRSHFDSLFWSMTTIFQVLSGENWNSVMYDAWRATSWPAVLYFVSLVVLGVFIVMNLFLAILLKRFDDNEDLVDSSTLQRLASAWDTTRTRVVSQTSDDCPEYAGKGDPKKQSKSNNDDIVFLRRVCCKIVENKYFESSITVLIVLSSLCLALDNPLTDPNSMFKKTLHVINMVFAIIFIGEMILKVIAHGFLFRSGAYLQNAWNVLDFTIVAVSVLEFAEVGAGKALRVLRTMRVLRPLRMINRFPELKIIVDALLLSFPSVGNVAVICALFFLIFAIFGVTFLKGTFYHCDGEAFGALPNEQVEYLTNPTAWGNLSKDEQAWFDVSSPGCMASSWDANTVPTSKEVCDCLAPEEWNSVTPQNFNNVLNGIALLFEISTTEGWVDVMYAAIDQRGVESQPVRDNNVMWAIFFILFLVVGAFFVLELFVGVTIENFGKIKEQKGRGLMTDAQREWASTQAFVMKIKPEKRVRRPKERFRGVCYDFIMPSTNPRFEQTITSCIILNCLCTAFVQFGDPEGKKYLLDVLNILFASIFFLEVVVKIFALQWKYFYDGWNRFDFAIVCGSTIGMLLNIFIAEAAGIISIIRLFRIGRLVRLIKSVKSLRTLFNTMVTSIPSIANIGALLFLLFFIYAVCGVQLYSTIALKEDLNEQANFRSFGNTMLLLLRFSTGENWNGFMRNMLNDKDGCDPEPKFNNSAPWCLTEDDYPTCTDVNGCGAGPSAFLYFYSFTLLGTFVILNLFVGVVLEAFESNSEGDILNPSDLEHFTSVWAEFDPDATWYIKAEKIKDLVSRLDTPLGLADPKNPTSVDAVEKIMSDSCLLEIPVNNKGMVNIVHVATHLAKRLAKEKQGDEFNELAEDHPIQRRIMIQKQGMQKTLREVHFAQSKKKVLALRAFGMTTKKASFSKVPKKEGFSTASSPIFSQAANTTPSSPLASRAIKSPNGS